MESRALHHSTSRRRGYVLGFQASELRNYFPVLLLIGLIALFSVLAPRFFTLNNFSILLQQAIVPAVAGLGMTFVILAGSIDLAVGSIVALSAYVVAFSVPTLGVFAWIPAVLVGLVCGTLNGVIFAKGKIPSFMVTLGAMVAYRGVVLMISNGAPVAIRDVGFLRLFSSRTLGIPHTVLIGVLILIFAYLLLERTPFGREVRAIGGGERIAVLSGIVVDRVKILIFALSGLLAGLAGVLQAARVYAATPQLGQGMELDVIATVVLGGTPLTGGIGGIPRTVLGALIVTILSNGLNQLGVSPYMQSIVKGTVLVAAVFLTIDRSKISVMK